MERVGGVRRAVARGVHVCVRTGGPYSSEVWQRLKGLDQCVNRCGPILPARGRPGPFPARCRLPAHRRFLRATGPVRRLAPGRHSPERAGAPERHPPERAGRTRRQREAARLLPGRVTPHCLSLPSRRCLLPAACCLLPAACRGFAILPPGRAVTAGRRACCGWGRWGCAVGVLRGWCGGGAAASAGPAGAGPAGRARGGARSENGSGEAGRVPAGTGRPPTAGPDRVVAQAVRPVAVGPVGRHGALLTDGFVSGPAGPQRPATRSGGRGPVVWLLVLGGWGEGGGVGGRFTWRVPGRRPLSSLRAPKSRLTV